MYITCLDMEGVLVPEIWVEFARESGIPELKRTTRDEPDYDKLMKWRLGVLREHGLGLREIQQTIARIDPLPGAKEFLDKLRSETQAIILSDTFEEFAQPLMKKLGDHFLQLSRGGRRGLHFRRENALCALQAHDRARPSVHRIRHDRQRR